MQGGSRFFGGLVAAALWLALGSTARAEGWSALADRVFEHLTAEQGLPRSIVTAIAQDADGFLWAGTQGGLARWDGYRFKNYRLNRQDPNALQDHFINVIHSDRKGRLWIGTASGGLSRYDRDNDRFATYGAGANGLSSVLVAAVIDDGGDGLWVGTDGGLDHLAPDTGQITHLRRSEGDANSLPDNHIHALLLDRAGALWVGSANGLSRRARGASGFESVVLPAQGKLDIRSLMQASDGRVWVGTANRGAFALDPTTGAAQAVDLSVFQGGAIDIIPAIAEIAPGEILIATYGHGLLMASGATLNVRAITHNRVVPTSLGDNRVWSLYQDRSGIVWVGDFAGLDRASFQPQNADTLFGAAGRPNGITNEDVTAVRQVADGRTWLGLYDKGVVAIDPQAGTIEPLPLGPAPDHMVIFSFTSLPNRDVLIGTVKGLYRTTIEGRGLKRLQWPGHDPLSRIDAVYVDGDRVWVGGRDEGLWMLDGIEGELKAQRPAEFDSFTDQRITAIVPAIDHSLWIGTWFGVTRIDRGGHVLERIVPDSKNPHALSAGHVGTLLTDREGRLWAGLAGGGIDVLVAHEKDGTARFAQLHGLPNPNIGQLLADDAGKIWLSSMDGVAAIDSDNFAVRALQRADGVAIPEYWHASGAVTATGDVLFGGRGGAHPHPASSTHVDVHASDCDHRPANWRKARTGGPAK